MLALAVSTMLLAGCGGAPNHDAPAGTTVVQDRIAYYMESSRELNPLEPDDRALLTGLPRG